MGRKKKEDGRREKEVKRKKEEKEKKSKKERETGGMGVWGEAEERGTRQEKKFIARWCGPTTARRISV